MKQPNGHTFLFGYFECGDEVGVTRNNDDVCDTSLEAKLYQVDAQQYVDHLLDEYRSSVLV